LPSGALPFPIGLALRYLRSTRKDAFVSFLSLVAALGIGLGVAALVIALAALTGMQKALRAEIVARTPALVVTPPRGADIAAATAALAAQPEITAVQASIEGRGWIVASGRAVPVVLTGYEGELPDEFPGAEGRAPGLYVGRATAARLGIGPDSIVTVASPRPSLTPFGPAPRTVTLPLAGMFDSGRSEEVARLALPLDRALVLLGDGRPRRLLAATTNLDAAIDVAGRIAGTMPPGTRVETWQDLNRPLFFALALEKSVMFVAVSLIVVVAALALIADLSLVAANKRRELGLLTAMGASATQLRRAFFWIGAFIGGAGALGGALLGVVAALVLDRARAIRMPSDVYFLDYLPFAVPVSDVALVIVVALALALLCAVHGASRAVRFDPITALKQ
jgi:lipoprotein-releasing system permease protein